MANFFRLFLLAISFTVVAGCGADDSLDVPAVDDSVVHSEETMKELEAQNASDMMSK